VRSNNDGGTISVAAAASEWRSRVVLVLQCNGHDAVDRRERRVVIL